MLAGWTGKIVQVGLGFWHLWQLVKSLKESNRALLVQIILVLSKNNFYCGVMSAQSSCPFVFLRNEVCWWVLIFKLKSFFFKDWTNDFVKAGLEVILIITLLNFSLFGPSLLHWGRFSEDRWEKCVYRCALLYLISQLWKQRDLNILYADVSQIFTIERVLCYHSVGFVWLKYLYCFHPWLTNLSVFWASHEGAILKSLIFLPGFCIRRQICIPLRLFVSTLGLLCLLNDHLKWWTLTVIANFVFDSVYDDQIFILIPVQGRVFLNHDRVMRFKWLLFWLATAD